MHPFILRRCRVGVEVNNFTVCEANSEAFLDEHVTLFLFGEGTASAASTFRRGLLLDECSLVIDQLRSFGQVDGGSRLSGSFMVRRELRALELEEASTPVLMNVSKICGCRAFMCNLLDSLLPADSSDLQSP